METHLKNVGGNFYDKYNSKNPFVKILMKLFTHKFVGILKELKFRSILDVGCGEGHFTNIIREELNDFGIKITALEFDPKTVKLANKLYPSLQIEQGSIYKLSGKYDVLIASEVLEHLEDVNLALKNCRSVSDACVFSVPHEPFWRFANILRCKYLKDLGNTPGHINHWGKKSFRKLLKNHFDDVKVITAGLWLIALCKNKKQI